MLGAAAAVALLAQCSIGSAASRQDAGRPAARPAPPGRKVLLHDGFDGPQLDGARWGTCHWWGPAGCTIGSNDELEWYLPGQVSVRDGALRLEARPAASQHDGRRLTYASGMVSSGRVGEGVQDRPRFAFTYGTVAVRFRTPRGAGLWPAIWMLPTSNEPLPEIDLLEQYGSATSSASLTLHTAGAVGDLAQGHEITGPDLAAGWHTVVLDWTPGRLRWSLDGKERYRIDGHQVPSQQMYLVVNLAVGGPAGAPAPTTAFPAALLVDEVTVWAAP